MKEWFTAQELADLALPGLPGTKRGIAKCAIEGWQNPEREWHAERHPLGTWRKRDGRGGGVEYHFSVLPMQAQVALLKATEVPEPPPTDPVAQARSDLSRIERWERFDQLPDRRKDVARGRLKVLQAVDTLWRGGMDKDLAVSLVAQQQGIGASTLYLWSARVRGIDRADWLPYLVDHYAGRTVISDMDAEAWAFIKALWLRVEQPSYEGCWRRLEEAAAKHGWAIPSKSSVKRRLLRDHHPQTIKLAREGAEAFERSLPALERDRSCFHAMEAVNADCHKFDTWILWPEEEEPVRVQGVFFQDLYSGAILSWRIDRTPNREMVRLALGDLIEDWGIPKHCWFDNGREFMSKWLTGRMKHRFRFKTKEEDPQGILLDLGVTVHATRPYHGQAKPIERAFRDFCDEIAKHPDCAGAWTGNKPEAKPENYKSKAVPLEKFLEIVAQEVQRHNARKNRESRICGGVHSFWDVFTESYAKAAAEIARPTPAQRRLWMMAAEGVKACAPDGSVFLEKNRYWCEQLSRVIGKKLTVRFDPQNLHAGVHLYMMDGTYLAFAECWEAVGFADADAARQHSQRLGRLRRAHREALEISRTMSIAEAARVMARPDIELPAPETKVIRGAFAAAGNTALKAVPQPVPREDFDTEAAFAKGLRLLVNND